MSENRSVSMFRDFLRRPSRAFFTAALAAIALIALSIFTVSFSVASTGGRGGVEESQRYIVGWHTYFVEPGDYLRIQSPQQFNSPIRDYVVFYIVEGGEAAGIAQGIRPPTVYVEQPLVLEDFEFRRPTPPEGKPHFKPEGWNPPIDDYDGLDVAYVVDKPAVAADDAGWISGFRSAAGKNPSVNVVNGLNARAQPTILVLAAIAVLAVPATGLWWLADYRRRPRGESAQGTESLLRVAHDVRSYMRVLRRLTAVNGLFLFVGGLMGLTAANYYMEDYYHYSPWPYWNETLMVALWFIFFVLMWVWIVHYRLVSKEERRIRADMAHPPLEL